MGHFRAYRRASYDSFERIYGGDLFFHGVTRPRRGEITEITKKPFPLVACDAREPPPANTDIPFSFLFSFFQTSDVKAPRSSPRSSCQPWRNYLV